MYFYFFPNRDYAVGAVSGTLTCAIGMYTSSLTLIVGSQVQSSPCCFRYFCASTPVMRCSALCWTNRKVLYADRHSAALPSWNGEMVIFFCPQRGGILASCAAVLLSHPIEQLGQDFSWKFSRELMRCLKLAEDLQVRQSADADSTACWCVLVDGCSVFVVLSVYSDSVKEHVACMVAKQSYMSVSIYVTSLLPTLPRSQPYWGVFRNCCGGRAQICGCSW